MGRYSTDPQTVQQSPVSPAGLILSSNPFCNPPVVPMQQGQQQNPMAGWPTFFPKPVVGLDIRGILIDETDVRQVTPIPGALDAVRILRLKGHKVFLLGDYPEITTKKITQPQVDENHKILLQLLGQSGCFSIDGMLHNTSSIKEDMYAKPNTGMMKRAANEFKVNWKEGWFVGDDIDDLKMADTGGCKPILILTGKGQETVSKLDSFANRELKKKVKIFPNLLSFVESL
jgi:D-glycero-D-manno-heptose 1,7-bisphosphate phosphatase